MATQTQKQTPPTVPGGQAGNYLVEVRKEMRKVNWPDRPELINNTILTLVSSFILSLMIFGADQVISRILSLVYGG